MSRRSSSKASRSLAKSPAHLETVEGWSRVAKRAGEGAGGPGGGGGEDGEGGRGGGGPEERGEGAGGRAPSRRAPAHSGLRLASMGASALNEPM